MTDLFRALTPGRRPAAFLALALALAPAASQAAPLTATRDFTAGIPVTPTDWGPGAPKGVTNPLQVPRFDPSLGTLQSVTIRADYDVRNDFSMRFIAPSQITVSATQTTLTVERPDKSALIQVKLPDVSRSDTMTGGPFPKPVTFPELVRTGSTDPLVLTSAADLALFTATSRGQTIALPALADSRSVFTSASANGDGTVATRAGLNLFVTYTYTPVPEPASLVVVGAGALGLLLVRRARG